MLCLTTDEVFLKESNYFSYPRNAPITCIISLSAALLIKIPMTKSADLA